MKYICCFFIFSLYEDVNSLVRRQSTVRLFALMSVAGVCFVYVYTPPAALVVSLPVLPPHSFLPDSLMQRLKIA